jgi:hypothetical protein
LQEASEFWNQMARQRSQDTVELSPDYRSRHVARGR